MRYTIEASKQDIARTVAALSAEAALQTISKLAASGFIIESIMDDDGHSLLVGDLRKARQARMSAKKLDLPSQPMANVALPT